MTERKTKNQYQEMDAFMDKLEAEKNFWQVKIQQQADEAIKQIKQEAEVYATQQERKMEENHDFMNLIQNLIQQGDTELAKEYMEKILKFR